MVWRLVPPILLGGLLWPSRILAAAPAEQGHEQALHVPLWTVLPFVGLLLSIALLPVVAGHFWHSNRNRGLVSGLFALPVIIFLGLQGEPGWHALRHAIIEYIDFIILLWALYTISGGIALQLNVRPSPLINGCILALGSALANLIGTTGASMLLIRPYLRINQQRQYNAHLPIFFIFMVSNLGGLLTPLGDPPLFLGFLRGVDFFWTLRLWPEWLLANGVVLLVFLIWDVLALRRETEPAQLQAAAGQAPLTVSGLINLVFLGGVVAAVLLQSPHVADQVTAQLRQINPDVPNLMLGGAIVEWVGIKWSVAVMVLMGLLSLALSPRPARAANDFSWAAIVEVAVLFIGIFVTMVPAVHLLKAHGHEFGITEPWQFFWLTGALSSFLDNAPTYVTFAEMAAGDHPIRWLMENRPLVLAAISCGAVFMGAMTYIGNGPNFMVKAISDENGYRTPSFFGYLVYSVVILVPTFILVMCLEFTPNLNW